METSPESASSSPVRLKLRVAFDGSRYLGWQFQKEGPSIQLALEKAFDGFLKRVSRVHGSSRTDAGVHARGLVAHVDVERLKEGVSGEKLRLALNAHLPDDIRVDEVVTAPRNFHAQYHAKGKQYRYFIWNHRANNPLIRNTCWHVPLLMNAGKAREAASFFVGERDYRSLACEKGYEVPSTVRHLTKCRLFVRDHLWTVVIEGDGFLYKMCRTIVGTIVHVAQGKIRANDLEAILSGKDRRLAGVTAPAQGLVLWKVYY